MTVVCSNQVIEFNAAQFHTTQGFACVLTMHIHCIYLFLSFFNNVLSFQQILAIELKPPELNLTFFFNSTSEWIWQFKCSSELNFHSRHRFLDLCHVQVLYKSLTKSTSTSSFSSHCNVCHPSQTIAIALRETQITHWQFDLRQKWPNKSKKIWNQRYGWITLR